MDAVRNNQNKFSKKVFLFVNIKTVHFLVLIYWSPNSQWQWQYASNIFFIGLAIASSVFNEVDGKEEMTKDPHSSPLQKHERKNMDRTLGCKLPLSQASHCEQDFGAHLAINGIANSNRDFYCSMFHQTGYPWILG